MLHSNVVEHKTRYCTLMCISQWPNKLFIIYSIIQSNVVPLYLWLKWSKTQNLPRGINFGIFICLGWILDASNNRWWRSIRKLVQPLVRPLIRSICLYLRQRVEDLTVIFKYAWVEQMGILYANAFKMQDLLRWNSAMSASWLCLRSVTYIQTSFKIQKSRFRKKLCSSKIRIAQCTFWIIKFFIRNQGLGWGRLIQVKPKRGIHIDDSTMSIWLGGSTTVCRGRIPRYDSTSIKENAHGRNSEYVVGNVYWIDLVFPRSYVHFIVI